MSAPSIRIVPAEGVSKPAIIRSVVVFPQPLGPRNDTNSPRWTSSSKCSTAVESANFFWRPWISSKPMRVLSAPRQPCRGSGVPEPGSAPCTPT